MKKKNLIIIAFSLLSLTNANSQALQGKVTDVKEMTLSNGLKVWVNEDHSQPKVYGALVVKAGAADCPNTGIAHYFEHMLFKGTDRIGTVDYRSEKVYLDSIAMRYNQLVSTSDESERLAIQKDINRLSGKAAVYAIPNEFNTLTSRYGGSDLNAGTSYDYTIYHNTFTPQYLRQWAMINSERMLTPVFRLFQSELEAVYEEKNMYQDNIMGTAMEKILGNVFKGSPYEYPLIGSTENLKSPNFAEMNEFFGKYYVAGNMVLMLCGDIKADTIAPLLEETFGRIRKGTAPERPAYTISYDGNQTAEISLPIPLVKASAYIYRAPNEGDRDAVALQVATSLLSNDNETGMIDSLVNVGDIMFGTCQYIALDREAALGVLAVPKIPFGSKKKAERLCLEQIDRLKRGDFSLESLEIAKRNALFDFESSLENIDKRAEMMTDAISSTSLSWQEYVDVKKSVATLTKDDITRVANKYFNDKYLRMVKKFGSYPKDHLSQPAYTPVVPGHNNEKSEYARMIDSIPTPEVAIRLKDFGNDVTTTKIDNHATLYSKKNPVNDIFNLSLIYHKGEKGDPRLKVLGEYLGAIGTDSLSKQEFGKALQRLGTTIGYKCGNNSFAITMKGLDSNLTPSIQLLGHFLTHAKADASKTDDILQAMDMEKSSFDKDYTAITGAIYSKLMYGDKSKYFNQLTSKDVKKMGGDSLVKTLDELRRYECSIAYSGNIADSEVAQAVKRYLSTDKSTTAAYDSYVKPIAVEKPTVYVYPSSKARQNVIAAYMVLPNSQSAKDNATQKVWGEYFGGDMSSVLFQEIREFRSLAYYAQGALSLTPTPSHPDAPSVYNVVMGTQADKTLQAIGVLDSLMNHQEVDGEGVALSKQSILNDVNNSYPSFRGIASSIADERVNGGYTADKNKELVDNLPSVTLADVQSFFDSKIKPATKAFIVVGNLSSRQMDELAKYGEVVTLKKEDFIRQ